MKRLIAPVALVLTLGAGCAEQAPDGTIKPAAVARQEWQQELDQDQQDLKDSLNRSADAMDKLAECQNLDGAEFSACVADAYRIMGQ